MAEYTIEHIAAQTFDPSVKHRIKALTSCRADYRGIIDEYYPSEERDFQLANLDLRIQRALVAALNGCIGFVREHYHEDDQDEELERLDAHFRKTIENVQGRKYLVPSVEREEDVAVKTLDNKKSLSDAIRDFGSQRRIFAEHVRTFYPSEGQEEALTNLDIRRRRALESARISRIGCIRSHYPVDEHAEEFANLDRRFRQALACLTEDADPKSMTKSTLNHKIIKEAAYASLGDDKSIDDHVADLKAVRGQYARSIRVEYSWSDEDRDNEIANLDALFRRAMQKAHREYVEFFKEYYSDAEERNAQMRMLDVRFRRVMAGLESCLIAPQKDKVLMKSTSMGLSS